MSRWTAAARRHPGLTYVALPCAVLVVLVLALWPAQRGTGQALTAKDGALVPVAQDRPAPGFSRPLLTGTGDLDLQAFRGNVLVVNFWASWCAVCRTELPRLRTLANQQPQAVFLGVDDSDTRSAGQAVLRSVQLGYPSVVDPDGSLLRAFGSVGIPSTFVVDRTGRIRFQAFGAVDGAALADAVSSVSG